MLLKLVPECRRAQLEELRGPGPVASSFAKGFVEKVHLQAGNDLVERHVLFGEAAIACLDELIDGPMFPKLTSLISGTCGCLRRSAAR